MWKKGYNANKPSWLEFYPSNRIFEGAKQEGPLLVDVGGGRGQDIELFRKKFPDLTIHRLVLEDQPSIIQAAHVGPGIQVVGLNMFEEQPVKGGLAKSKSAIPTKLPRRDNGLSTVQQFANSEHARRSDIFPS